MTRREHHPERREDDVEALVGERQRLGVPLDPVDRRPGFGGQPATRLEQLGGEVESDDTGTGAGGPQRRVPGAARDIEHVLARPDAAAHHDSLPKRPKLAPGDLREVAGGPGLPRTPLELGQQRLLGQGGDDR